MPAESSILDRMLADIASTPDTRCPCCDSQAVLPPDPLDDTDPLLWRCVCCCHEWAEFTV